MAGVGAAATLAGVGVLAKRVHDVVKKGNENEVLRKTGEAMGRQTSTKEAEVEASTDFRDREYASSREVRQKEIDAEIARSEEIIRENKEIKEELQEQKWNRDREAHEERLADLDEKAKAEDLRDKSQPRTYYREIDDPWGEPLEKPPKSRHKKKKKKQSHRKQDSIYEARTMRIRQSIRQLHAQGRFDSGRYDALNCSPGNKPCGSTCIPQKYTCHANKMSSGGRKRSQRRGRVGMPKMPDFPKQNLGKAVQIGGTIAGGLAATGLLGAGAIAHKEIGAGVRQAGRDISRNSKRIADNFSSGVKRATNVVEKTAKMTVDLHREVEKTRKEMQKEYAAASDPNEQIRIEEKARRLNQGIAKNLEMAQELIDRELNEARIEIQEGFANIGDMVNQVGLTASKTAHAVGRKLSGEKDRRREARREQIARGRTGGLARRY